MPGSALGTGCIAESQSLLMKFIFCRLELGVDGEKIAVKYDEQEKYQRVISIMHREHKSP